VRRGDSADDPDGHDGPAELYGKSPDLAEYVIDMHATQDIG
jgi:hypothetical protein